MREQQEAFDALMQDDAELAAEEYVAYQRAFEERKNRNNIIIAVGITVLICWVLFTPRSSVGYDIDDDALTACQVEEVQ